MRHIVVDQTKERKEVCLQHLGCRNVQVYEEELGVRTVSSAFLKYNSVKQENSLLLILS